MLKIENTEFKTKFTDINLRQRIYENKSYLTLIITTEFYPTLVNENIVSGTIEAKVDIEDLHSLSELEDKSLKGDIGSVTISVNNDGIWEHQSQDNFQIKFGKKTGRELKLTLKTDNCSLSTNGTIISLYTTSTSKEVLESNFDLQDFYPNAVSKEIGKNKIFKYYTKD